MPSKIRSQKFFAATTILWVLFAFISFLDQISAAPSQQRSTRLSRRVDAPGLGVELEFSPISITTKQTLSKQDQEKIKGGEMTPDGFAGEPKTNWKLTAEIPSDGTGNSVFPEAIVDGLRNMVGDYKTKDIGQAITRFFTEWAPCRAKACTVTIAGADKKFDPWTVHWPKDNPRDLTRVNFGSQVTTAMPFEAILKILGDSKNKNPTPKNPLASSGNLNSGKFKILKKDDFKTFSKINANDINDEFLGFFSLLASYSVLAHTSTAKEGPKRIVPIMPRTNFVTQYTTFVESKLKAQLDGGQTTLYDIIEKVTGSDAKLAKETFTWTGEKAGAVVTPIGDTWNGMDADAEAGTLEVQKFLDYIQGWDRVAKKALSKKLDLVELMDKMLRHGQIGGLGAKLEPLYQGTKNVPIFEFRDLDPIKGSDLGTALEAYENKVIAYHTGKA